MAGLPVVSVVAMARRPLGRAGVNEVGMVRVTEVEGSLEMVRLWPARVTWRVRLAV